MASQRAIDRAIAAAAGHLVALMGPRDILRPGTSANRLLRCLLIVIAMVPTLIVFYKLVTIHGVAIDLEIPLRAAERWQAGGEPYLPSSFAVEPGFDVPFLYPPLVLPLVAPLLELPRPIVWYGWIVLCLAASVWACRRLRIPLRWIPLIVVSPLFAEGWIGGNVQILLFAGFVALFFAAKGPTDLRPTPRDPTSSATPAAREGGLAAAIAAFKVSQLHAWAYMLLKRPVAALIGAVAVVLLALATVPLTGTGLWFDWLEQIRRAADPDWNLAGVSLYRYLPPPAPFLVTAVTLVLLVQIPRGQAGAWIGLLAVLGAPSLHVYGMLFAMPAWLAIRRELAIVAGFWLGTATELGLWLGFAIVAISFSLASWRLPALFEPQLDREAASS